MQALVCLWYRFFLTHLHLPAASLLADGIFWIQHELYRVRVPAENILVIIMV